MWTSRPAIAAARLSQARFCLLLCESTWCGSRESITSSLDYEHYCCYNYPNYTGEWRENTYTQLECYHWESCCCCSTTALETPVVSMVVLSSKTSFSIGWDLSVGSAQTYFDSLVYSRLLGLHLSELSVCGAKALGNLFGRHTSKQAVFEKGWEKCTWQHCTECGRHRTRGRCK